MVGARRPSGRLAGALAAIAIIGMATAWAVVSAHDLRSQAGKDRREVARMTAYMKPTCVGRFVIELPAYAEAELTMANVDGLDIATRLESLADFQTRLADPEAELRATPDRLDGDMNLELVMPIKTANGLFGKIFLYGRVVTEGTQANGLAIEGYRYEGIAVDALVHGSGVSIDLTADAYQPARTHQVAQLISQLVPNPENEIPPETGFCLDHAYFRGLLNPDQAERITMNARLTSHPDIAFTLKLAAGVEPDAKGLIARTAESWERMPLMDRARLATLRAGQRIVGCLIGEEVVERVVESDTVAVHSFWWEFNGTVDDVMAPHFSFTMDTGVGDRGPVPASLSDSRAVLLWDQISSSIHALASKCSPSAQRTGT